MDLTQIEKALKENSLRVTKTRLSVADVLLENKNKYLSSQEIYKIILKKKDSSCDYVSVYRILTKFVEIGIVRKSEFYNEASRYTLNELLSGQSKHEHYFKCNKCYTIEPFSDCFIHQKEKELTSLGYSHLNHHLEITGLCPRCS
ncbi:MAG: transcriptional repressor [Bacteriovoracaceae bacterium]|jgi:Fe2+ or Zn2+ uptake regulation protein|nr:transcriptional repressor [Bacteriovoracaceae bacterium]